MSERRELLWPGFELQIDRPSELVWSDLPTADEKWTYVDKQGHGHFWKDNDYPTLDAVWEPCTMGHDDCDGDRHWECKVCREEIRPGTRPSDPVRINGPVSITLTIHEPGRTRTYALDDDLWNSLDVAVRGAIDEVLPSERLVDLRITGPG